MEEKSAAARKLFCGTISDNVCDMPPARFTARRGKGNCCYTLGRVLDAEPA